jgi:hypothetical protein
VTGHLSAFLLDELAAAASGAQAQTPPEARAHLGACAQCRGRLDALSNERAQALRDPRFERTFARLPKKQRQAPRFLWPLLAGAGAAAALFLVFQPGDRGLRAGLRTKGAASMSLFTRSGAPVSAPRVGEQVELRVLGAGHRFALLAARDESGHVSVLWPAGAGVSGALPSGALLTLPLAATPGRVRVVALFSDQPLSLGDLLAQTAPAASERRELLVEPLP